MKWFIFWKGDTMPGSKDSWTGSYRIGEISKKKLKSSACNPYLTEEYQITTDQKEIVRVNDPMT